MFSGGVGGGDVGGIGVVISGGGCNDGGCGGGGGSVLTCGYLMVWRISLNRGCEPLPFTFTYVFESSNHCKTYIEMRKVG